MTNVSLLGRRLIKKSVCTRRTCRGSVISMYQRTLFFSSSDDHTAASTNSTTSTYGSTVESSGVMSKGDLVKMIAEENDMSQAQSGRIVNSIFDTIIEVSESISDLAKLVSYLVG